eukprot:scaffold38584_cov31-Tisochrysis_lutea.AAC.5
MGKARAPICARQPMRRGVSGDGCLAGEAFDQARSMCSKACLRNGFVVGIDDIGHGSCAAGLESSL